MKLILNSVRMAFGTIWEPKQFNGQGEAATSASFILTPAPQPGESAEAYKKRKDALAKQVIDTIQAVASEKWGAKAADVLKTLKAKGDVCLHDGNTKAEYDGFAGNLFVSGRNKGKPAIIAARKLNGKAVSVDQNGNAYVEGVKVDNLPFPVKAPYNGCYVNVVLDVWAQENGYGKRINAKLLAIQFSADGDSFSGGAGFDEADFDDQDDGEGTSSDAWGSESSSDGDGFGFGGDSTSDSAGGFFN